MEGGGGAIRRCQRVTSVTQLLHVGTRGSRRTLARNSDVSRETIGAEAKKETGQVIVITWPACSLEPTSGFEPLTYALRVRCSTS